MAYSHLEKLLRKIYSDKHFHTVRNDKTVISWQQGHYLQALCRQEQPSRIIELGVNYGFASLWMYSGASVYLKQMVCVDPWLPQKNNAVAEYLKKDKKVSYVTNQTSQEYLAGLIKNQVRSVDLICVDADEKFDGVMTDLYFAFKLIRIGGVITVRNTWNPSVRKALLFYLKNFPVTLCDVPDWQIKLFRSMPLSFGWLLRRLVGTKDFCTMRLVADDKRAWNHFVPF